MAHDPAQKLAGLAGTPKLTIGGEERHLPVRSGFTATRVANYAHDLIGKFAEAVGEEDTNLGSLTDARVVLRLAPEIAWEILTLITVDPAEVERLDCEGAPGDVDEYLASERKRLTHRIRSDELLPAVETVIDVLLEEVEGKDEQLRRLREKGRRLMATFGASEDEAEPATGPTGTTTTPSTPASSSLEPSEEATAVLEPISTGSAPESSTAFAPA